MKQAVKFFVKLGRGRVRVVGGTLVPVPSSCGREGVRGERGVSHKMLVRGGSHVRGHFCGLSRHVCSWHAGRRLIRGGDEDKSLMRKAGAGEERMSGRRK